jgi:hypothetical protein
VTDTAVQVRQRRITQSMLGNADKCLLSFQYGLDKPEWAKPTAGADRAVGTGYHAGLELYYDARKDAPGLNPNAEEMIDKAVEIFDISTELDLYDNTPVEVFKWSEKVPDKAHAHDLIALMTRAYVDERWWWPHEFTVVETETNMTVHDEHGTPFKLGADLTLLDSSRYVVLVDHKTANKAWDQNKHHPRKQNQAPLYTWAARQAYAELDIAGVRFVFDIIQFPGVKTPVRFDRRISDPTPAHEAAVVKKAQDLMALYQAVHVELGRDLPANPSSTLCNPKWCDYFDGCPHGAALD